MLFWVISIILLIAYNFKFKQGVKDADEIVFNLEQN